MKEGKVSIPNQNEQHQNDNRNRNNNRNRRFKNNRRNNNRPQQAEQVKRDPRAEQKEQQMAHEFFKTSEEDIQNCPYCEKPVKFLSTAIHVSGESNPVHFDCILERIQTRENLLENQKVTYLGKGSFGIIEKISESPGFKITKKIDIETDSEKALWRKEMSNRIQKYTVEE